MNMKYDLDKESVQALVVVCGTVIAVAALLYDGELGNALGTGVLSMAGVVVGYLFGKGGNTVSAADDSVSE
jgi:hypothetical protein